LAGSVRSRDELAGDHRDAQGLVGVLKIDNTRASTNSRLTENSSA